ncbi:MAG: hypothetical protein IMZ51_02305 [Chloroflexi bacterium]|nr:hypothetical protein [Chloroflexota bacterium]
MLLRYSRAAWSFVNISQAILGIKPDYEGLLIDPCLPSSWTGYKVERLFRGVKYIIEVKKPKGISKGVSRIILDKEELGSNILPILKDNKTHYVEVYIE